MAVEAGAGALPRLGWVAVGLVVVIAALAISADPADAARKKRKRVVSYNPPYASIVVDANTGAVLQATNADSRRHPASLTKIMTLYLLFERIESGRFKLSTRLPVSAHAASQAPTKLGLKPGQTIEVEDAILGLVTKSANDAAAVVAEAIGGTEAGFARMMTRKARALGMRSTAYTNASGLPDVNQVTTARDQAVLGRAIQERFPRYYHYFATAAFEFRGRAIRNHNKLLGRVQGVDGIKTGYTRASGFNLVTSMHRGRRHVVAVVLGGRSGSTRDARMRDLLSAHIMTASIRRTAPAIVEAAAEREEQRVAAGQEAVPMPVGKPLALHQISASESTASVQPPAIIPAVAVAPQPKPGSTDPIRPLLVKTVSIKPATKTARAAKPKSDPMPPPLPPAVVEGQEPSPIKTAAIAAAATHEEAVKPAPRAAKAEEKPVRSGWMIQVGAFGEEKEARVRLSSVQSRAKKLLGRADAFTETVTKGEKTFYRARFAGLDKGQAEAACRTLKRSDIACLPIKN
jgi:D-alanyl-D-alanine carboxypeptidase